MMETLNWFKNRIKKMFEPTKYKRTQFVFDWFNDYAGEYNGTYRIKPARAYNVEAVYKYFKDLADGEVLVALEERRIFQKTDGKLIEWKRVNRIKQPK